MLFKIKILNFECSKFKMTHYDWHFECSKFKMTGILNVQKASNWLGYMDQVFLNTIFVSSHMYPENPEGTRVIVGSMNMEYVSDTVKTRSHNLHVPKCAPILRGHRDGHKLNLSFVDCKITNAVIKTIPLPYKSVFEKANSAYLPLPVCEFDEHHGRPEGEQGVENAPSGFGHLVEQLAKILTFCVLILTFGQNTNICSPKTVAPHKNICSPYKTI